MEYSDYPRCRLKADFELANDKGDRMDTLRSVVHAVMHDLTIEELEDMVRLIQAVLMERRDPNSDEALYSMDCENSVEYSTPPTNLRPRYQNPENRLEDWSGRGLKPVWLRDLIARGYDLEALRFNEKN